MESVEHLLKTEAGGVSMVAGLLVILCLHLILRIVSMGIGLIKHLRAGDVKKMNELATSMNHATDAIKDFNSNLTALNKRIVEMDVDTQKNEKGLERLVATVKKLAGDRWSQIQREVREDEFNPTE